MFHITKYQHSFLENETESLTIFFKYFGDERKIKIKVLENSFKVRDQEIGGIINVKQNVEYWVGDVQRRPVMYNNDLTVNFIDALTGEILESKFIRTKKVHIDKRSFGKDFSKKNTWIIGDSHVNHNLIFGFDYNVDLYENDKTIINPVAHPLLSINRFINSDYIAFIKTLPIFDSDDICFYFGEIDTRVGIIRNSEIKNISYVTQTINLLQRFIDSILHIQKEFPKCKIYYILPNPPIQDGWIYGDNLKLFFNDSSEKNRFLVRYIFEDIIKKELDKIGVEIIDLNKHYIKKNMFVDEKFLIENNHHFKYPNNFLHLLKDIFN